MKHDGHSRTVDVRIPPGVGDGSRVRVSGEGEHGAGGATSGDLYLRIHLAPDTRFERKGQDLHAKVRVPVTTAVLGGEAEVPNLGGKPLRLKIPAGTESGQKFRLRERGFPSLRNPKLRGDEFAEVKIVLPKVISEETKEVLRQFEKLNPENQRKAMGLD